MSQFIESICYDKGEYKLLPLHQERVNKVFEQHYPKSKPHKLRELLPQKIFEKRHKFRVLYDETSYKVEHARYFPADIKTLRVIKDDNIAYGHKYADRNRLKALYELRSEADDIIIVKQDLVTDSYFANLLFWDGDKWYTPESYLLNGIKRQHLLKTGEISETEIRREDIPRYKKVSLINAMLDPGEIEVATEDIRI